MHCVCNHKEQMKVRKSVKFGSGLKAVELQHLEQPKHYHKVKKAFRKPRALENQRNITSLARTFETQSEREMSSTTCHNRTSFRDIGGT